MIHSCIHFRALVYIASITVLALEEPFKKSAPIAPRSGVGAPLAFCPQVVLELAVEHMPCTRSLGG